jgi:hypothetical protein
MADERKRNISEILEESGDVKKELEEAKKALEEGEKYQWVADEIKKVGL